MPPKKANRAMKIAIVIFGIPRATDVTLEPFIRNIVTPALQVGEVGLFGHLFEQRVINNTRSGENTTLDESNYTALKEHFQLITELPGAAHQEPRWSKLKAAGDFYADEFQSLTNLIHQLHSIQQANNLAIFQFDPDAIIFARPDLLYHDAIPLAAIKDACKHPMRCHIPAWQWWGGYNDRLAVCGRLAARAWAHRLDMATDYCDASVKPLHAEKLVRFALKKQSVQVRLLPVTASRVRAGGTVREEIFDPLKSYSSRKGLLEMTRAKILTSLGI